MILVSAMYSMELVALQATDEERGSFWPKSQILRLFRVVFGEGCPPSLLIWDDEGAGLDDRKMVPMMVYQSMRTLLEWAVEAGVYYLFQ